MKAKGREGFKEKAFSEIKIRRVLVDFSNPEVIGYIGEGMSMK